MRTLKLAVALLTTTGAAIAQTNCPPPAVKILRSNEVVPATGSAMAPSVRLEVTPDPECAGLVSYKFRNAELTLVRARRPLMPAMSVRQPEVDLKAWMRVAQPGDRIYVFIPYSSLIVVAADGSQQPYSLPQRPQSKRELDLTTDEAQGISFNWLLVKK